MAKKMATIKKPTISWKVEPVFARYRLKNTNTHIYFIPTVEYVHNHDDDFFNGCQYDLWRVCFKFFIFGIGIRICKETY